MATILQTTSDGTVGQAVTALTWGFDSITNNGAGSLVFDAATAGTSGSSVLVTQGTGAIYGVWSSTLAPQTSLWGAVELRLTGLPSASNHLIVGVDTAGAQAWAIDLGSTGTLLLRNAANTNVKTSTATIPLNTWVRIEFHVDHTAGTLQAWLYPSATATTATEDSGVIASAYGAQTDMFQVGSKNATPQVPPFRLDRIALADAKTGPLTVSSTPAPTYVVPAGWRLTRRFYRTG